MESVAHRTLKSLAVHWLLSRGCVAVGEEVAAPLPRWRFDAAGWADSGGDPRSIVVECKQARADFLREDSSVARLLEDRERWSARCEDLAENVVKRHEPHLRHSGSALFSEMESWDLGASRVTAYRRALAELRRIEEALYGETKFSLMARYALADELYVLAPAGLIRRRELPMGWGLLEVSPPTLRRLQRTGVACAWRGDALLPEDPPVIASVLAPVRKTLDARRLRLLRNIAVSATRAAYRAPVARPGPAAT